MAVPVRAGRHLLELRYRNGQVARGALVAAGAAAALAALLAWRRRAG
jgi:hypothetical protein